MIDLEKIGRDFIQEIFLEMGFRKDEITRYMSEKNYRVRSKSDYAVKVDVNTPHDGMEDSVSFYVFDISPESKGLEAYNRILARLNKEVPKNANTERLASIDTLERDGRNIGVLMTYHGLDFDEYMEQVDKI